MSRTIVAPPPNGLRQDGTVAGGWWHDDPASGRIVCDLCPRECHLKEGDRGFCFVRQNVGNEMVLTTYGRSTGFCIDPIEKKPLNHFLPGTFRAGTFRHVGVQFVSAILRHPQKEIPLQTGAAGTVDDG